MLDNYLVDFLLSLYQKVKIYFFLTKKHPLASIDVMQLNVPDLKSYFGNIFWALFYNPDHCAVHTSVTQCIYGIPAVILSELGRENTMWL